jgi:hypothetical protein
MSNFEEQMRLFEAEVGGAAAAARYQPPRPAFTAFMPQVKRTLLLLVASPVLWIRFVLLDQGTGRKSRKYSSDS